MVDPLLPLIAVSAVPPSELKVTVSVTAVHWAKRVTLPASLYDVLAFVPPVAALNQPSKVLLARVGVGMVMVVPSLPLIAVSAVPPSELKVTVSVTAVHWAKRVTLPASLYDVLAFVPPVAALNQPSKVLLARVGVGMVMVVPSLPLIAVSAVPPSELKVTVSMTAVHWA